METWSIFAISNETIEISNKIIWHFHFWHFLWNSNWKEIARPWQKAKKEKLKTKTNGRGKRIKEMKVIFVEIFNGNNFNSYTPQSFRNMVGRSNIPKLHLPCPFSKMGKRCPNLGKNYLHCGHLWVKFFVYSAFFKSL